MEEFRQKSQTLGPGQPGADLRFWRLPPAGVYALYQLQSSACSIWAAWAIWTMPRSWVRRISSGTIVTFYMYISKFFTPIQNLAEQFNWLQSALCVRRRRSSPSWTLQPKMHRRPGCHRAGRGQGRDRVPATSGSAMSPASGCCRASPSMSSPRQTVAFVGSTGSGKSTILSLICRNYEFQKGEILIDGIDIRKIKISCLRKPLRTDAAGCVPLLGHHPQQHCPAGGEYLRTTRSWRSAATSTRTTSSTSWTTAWTRKCGSGATTSRQASASCSALPAPSSISPA